ncbi:MAG: phenylacetate--CoA ligase [Gammaproteobacteria bacterium]|nr:phenylacetate--CoA ligase [Gammaproteobacteria bacterium]
MLNQVGNLDADKLLVHQQELWQAQSLYVSRHSHFYRDLWQGRKPPANLGDLAELPLSAKAQLRLSQAATPPFGDYLASTRDVVTRLHRTSGTSGQAMNLALSARDCEITEALGGRSQCSAGLRAEHSVVHCLNYQMWMGGVTDHLTLEKTGAMVVPFGVGGTELLIRTILEIGINAISCTPSYPAVLEKVLDEHFPDLTPRDLGLKLGLFGGEAGLDDPAFRKRIRDTWGMEPRNANYGVSDVMSNFAAQCEHDTRLHFLAADNLYPEIIDPESEQPLPLEPGTEGELVLTHLLRDCQPLVRFRSGDIIALDEMSACRCGHRGMRFRVVGRSDDMVVVRGLNIFPSMVAAVINAFDELSGNYRIVLDSKPPYDLLPISVELAPEVEARDGLAAGIEAAVKNKLGASSRVTVLRAHSFELSEGKTSRVVRTCQ